MSKQLEASLILRVSALRESSVSRALRGTVDAARKGSDQMVAAQRRAAKDGTKATRENVEAFKKAIREKEQTAIGVARRELRETRLAEAGKQREAVRTARLQEREAIRASRLKQREADRTAQAIVRAESKARREAEKTATKQIQEAERASSRRRAILKGIAGGVAGAAGGALHGAIQLGGRAQQLAGVDDRITQLRNAEQVERIITVKGNEAGLSGAQKDIVRSRIMEGTEAGQMNPADLANALSDAQTRFADFMGFADIAPQLAEAAFGLNENMQDLVGATGTANKTFGVSYLDALEIITSGAAEGAVGAGELSNAGARYMGLYAEKTGHSGEEGLREFGATYQLLEGKGQQGAEVSGNSLEAFLRMIGQKKTRDRLKKAGVNIAGEDGAMLPMVQVLDQLVAKEAVLKQPGRMEKIFGDSNAVNAATYLTAAHRDDPELFDRVYNSQGGIDRAKGNAAELRSRPMGKMNEVAVQSQLQTMRDADEIVEKALPFARAKTEFESDNPFLTELAGPIGSVVASAGGTAMAMKMLGMLGGGSAAAGAGGAAAAGGTVAAAGGLSGMLAGAGAAVGLGAAGTGILLAGTGLAAGYGASAALGGMGYTGDTLGKMLFAMFGPDAPATEDARSGSDGKGRARAALNANKALFDDAPAAVPGGTAAGETARAAGAMAADTVQALHDNTAISRQLLEEMRQRQQDVVKVAMTVSPEGKPQVTKLQTTKGVQADVMLGRTGAAL